MFNLSIIVAGIRSEKWLNLLEELKKSVGSLTYEVIFVGPSFPQSLDGTKHSFIRSFASPSKAFMEGAAIASGDYLCQCPDDGILFEDGLKKAFDSIQGNRQSISIIRYNEGENFSGKEFELGYWNTNYHPFFNSCAGIKPEWDAGPWFMANYSYFMEMGGIDCRFEHLNLCVNDLIYRSYMNGGNTVLSPTVVASLDWQPGQTPQTHPCCAAFIYNDLPLLQTLYRDEMTADNREIKINQTDWKLAPKIWKRRF